MANSTLARLVTAVQAEVEVEQAGEEGVQAGEEQAGELEEVENFTQLLEGLERSAVVVQGEGHFAAAEEQQQEEVQEEVQAEVQAEVQTPVSRRRPRLQSQGTRDRNS